MQQITFYDGIVPPENPFHACRCFEDFHHSLHWSYRRQALPRAPSSLAETDHLINFKIGGKNVGWPPSFFVPRKYH